MCGITGPVQFDGSTPDRWMVDRMHLAWWVRTFLDRTVALTHDSAPELTQARDDPSPLRPG